MCRVSRVATTVQGCARGGGCSRGGTCYIGAHALEPPGNDCAPCFRLGPHTPLLDDTGNVASQASLQDTTNTFIAWRIAGGGFGDPARAILIEYNAGITAVTATLPGLYPGMSWWLACDTSATAAPNNSAAPGQETQVTNPTYTLASRSVIVLVEHP
jgi:hypothetical protein